MLNILIPTAVDSLLENFPLDKEVFDKLELLEKKYFEPLLTIETKEITELLKRNRENFKLDATNFLVFFFKNIDINKFTMSIEEIISILSDKIKSSQVPRKIIDIFIEALNLETENSLLMMKYLNETSFFPALGKVYGNKRAIRFSFDEMFFFEATTYFIRHYSREQYKKALKFSRLSLKYANKRDALVETFLIEISPERRETIENASKETGQVFESHEELRNWMLKS